jgi:hypothetical protein
MATTCDMCGYRNSELKPGGEIPAKGKKITLRVQNGKDLTRDVIKVRNLFSWRCCCLQLCIACNFFSVPACA